MRRRLELGCAISPRESSYGKWLFYQSVILTNELGMPVDHIAATARFKHQTGLTIECSLPFVRKLIVGGKWRTEELAGAVPLDASAIRDILLVRWKDGQSAYAPSGVPFQPGKWKCMITVSMGKKVMAKKTLQGDYHPGWPWNFTEPMGLLRRLLSDDSMAASL
jgi:hypothetical protein